MPRELAERPGSLAEVPDPVTTFVVNIIYRGLQVLTWLVPGYIVGFKTGKRGILHGLIVGLVGYVGATAIWQFAFPVDAGLTFGSKSLIFPFLLTGLLCALAGGVGELHATKGRRI